jgi:membrane protease subunit HflC
MNARVMALAATLAVLVFLAANAVYVVDPRQYAIVSQFGRIERVEDTQGLKFKIPFIQDVTRVDRRLLHLEAPEFTAIAGDQKQLVVDAFARYHVLDARLFFETLRNDNARIEQLLGNYVNSGIRDTLGRVPLQTVLTERRAELMREITRNVNLQAKGVGVEVVDVRIKRADLPPANSQAVFERMKTEREREARQFRAEGDEESQRIRAGAEREKVVLIADAQRKAQIARGEGDGASVKIYAEAFGRDPEFYAFYRSMQAYRQALGKDSGTTMVLTPDSDFFRFFGRLDGAAPKLPVAPK